MNRFGSGLVTLFALALGLGCLNLALQGLMDGAVSAASGAPAFQWATKPVKFVLIELFWTGLGLLLLVVAWRGVFGPHADGDEDDEGDEDEGELPRPSARRQAATLPAPQTTPGTSAMSVRAAIAPRAAALLPRALDGDTGPAALPAGGYAALAPAAIKAIPPPLSLYPSRPYAVFVFVVMTAFTASAAYTTVALTSLFGTVGGAILFAPLALAWLRIAYHCVRNFFWQGPVLVLDRFGITNHRKGGHLIPWTEVDAVDLEASRSATYLVLRFRHADDLRAHFGFMRLLPAMLLRVVYKGYGGHVKLTSLSFKRAEVLRTAQAFVRYARR